MHRLKPLSVFLNFNPQSQIISDRTRIFTTTEIEAQMSTEAKNELSKPGYLVSSLSTNRQPFIYILSSHFSGDVYPKKHVSSIRTTALWKTATPPPCLGGDREEWELKRACTSLGGSRCSTLRPAWARSLLLPHLLSQESPEIPISRWHLSFFFK